MSKFKETSEVVLKEEFNFYPFSVWKEAMVSGNRCVMNEQTGNKYYGADAVYLMSLICLEEMRRNKLKLSPEEKVLAYFNDNVPGKPGFSCFIELLEQKGLSVNDFAKSFVKNSKSLSDGKVFEALMKECFPFKVPKCLSNRLLFDLYGGGNRRHFFNNFLPKSYLEVRNKHSSLKVLGAGSWKEQDLYVGRNGLTTWISIIGMGLSFHKILGKSFFSKNETHYFLNAPSGLDVGASIVYAIAYAYTKNHSMALKLSKQDVLADEVFERLSSIQPFLLTESLSYCLTHSYVDFLNNVNLFNVGDNRQAIVYIHYLFDVIRLLSVEANGVPSKDLSEVVDYLIMGFWESYKDDFIKGRLVVSKHNEVFSKKVFLSNEDKYRLYGIDLLSVIKSDHKAVAVLPRFDVLGRGWTFKGLYRDTISWHHKLAREKIIGEGSWGGLPFEDCYWENKDPQGNVLNTVYVEQIKRADDLREEGSKMRHCVAGYVDACRKGRVAIFSMYRSYTYGSKVKMVTIRVSYDGYIKEARGFGNRNLKSEEKVYLENFARFNNLRISI